MSLNESFSADKEWLINDEDRVEFIVDLSHYYNSLDEIDELIEPFNLSASYQEEPIEAIRSKRSSRKMMNLTGSIVLFIR